MIGVETNKRALALLLVALVAVAGALLPSAAGADGDPASDVLLSQSAFLPADADMSGSQEAQLDALLRGAHKAGLPIRIAFIPSGYDLGSVTVLWLKPRTYASFLGIELSLTFKGPLLVVMPNGFGLNWPGHSTASAYRLLAKLPVKPGGAGLLSAAQAATTQLAGAAGIKLASPAHVTNGASATAQPDGDGQLGRDLLILLLLLIVVAVAVAITFGSVRHRRRHTYPQNANEPASNELVPHKLIPHEPVPHEPVPHEYESFPNQPFPNQPASISPGVRPARLRWAMPSFVLLLGVLVPVLAFVGPPSAKVVAGTPEDPPFIWPAGRQAAPNFLLRDQNGDPVSIAAYRGRPVIVTFIDPLCREVCPLAAQELSRVDRQLPASQRPAIIAVSVDIYGNARANLLQDFDKWHLVPQWRWAVGSPRRLGEVWSRYGAEVEVKTKRIAGTTVHYITHSEMAYVIDGSGHERALFAWPYTAGQVEHTLRGLSRS